MEFNSLLRFFKSWLKNNDSIDDAIDDAIDDSSSINNILTKDVLLIILKHLSLTDQLIMRSVCKKWKELIEYLLENQKNLVIERKRIEMYSSSKIKKHLKDLSNNDVIKIDANYEISYKMINLLIDKCPNLKTLIFDNIKIKDERIQISNFSMKINENSLKKVEVLIINVLKNFKHNTIGDLIRLIVSRCGSNLKYVELSTHLSSDSVKYLIQNAPNIESFVFYYYKYSVVGKRRDILNHFQENLQHLKLLYFDHEDIEDLCQSRCKNLKRLHLSSPFEFITHADKMLKIICENFKFLSDINWDLRDIQSAQDLDVIPKKLNNLEILRLRLAHDVDFNHVLHDIIKANNRLKEIEIIDEFGFTDNSIKNISNYCPLIEKLVIEGSEYLTDTSLISISNLNKLKILSLEYSNITDDGLIKIISHCNLIEELNIYYCQNVTNKFLLFWIEMIKEKSISKQLKIYAGETKINYNDIELPKNLKFERQKFNFNH